MEGQILRDIKKTTTKTFIGSVGANFTCNKQTVGFAIRIGMPGVNEHDAGKVKCKHLDNLYDENSVFKLLIVHLTICIVTSENVKSRVYY
ncbi:hypothetical protein HZ326_8632 [Fusarium oxysporum f. sp. albedinis]|nr:hypothetical protein HZ326_8632 [Fusarium oxysporum f. sp. albedinis]